jgi:hypothetical protein
MPIRAHFAVVALASSLVACSDAERSKPLPLAVDGGRGSEFGNYAAVDAGMVTIDGQRCYAWNWDRPISPDLVVRYRSASCPSPQLPGRYVARDLGRSIIPLSESNLRSEPAAPVQ